MTFPGIYSEFEAGLRRYAMSLARGDPAAADDLVQETFVRASANLALLRGLNDRRRQAWLGRVLKNVFIDERRVHLRDERLIEQLVREAEIAPYTSHDVMSTDLLDNAPAEDRELLEQRYVQGMTSADIAQELGIPAATVRSRLRSAIRRLRLQQGLFGSRGGHS